MSEPTAARAAELEARADELDAYYNALPDGIVSEAHADAENLRHEARKIRSAASGAGLDRLLTQMQETGRIPTGGRFNLAWLLGFLGELGIDPASVDINVRDERIEVVS